MLVSSPSNAGRRRCVAARSRSNGGEQTSRLIAARRPAAGLVPEWTGPGLRVRSRRLGRSLRATRRSWRGRTAVVQERGTHGAFQLVPRRQLPDVCRRRRRVGLAVIRRRVRRSRSRRPRCFRNIDGTVSPDGRWIAYQSDESSGITRSGEGDVFVQSFPQPGFTRQVSTGGGFSARWSGNGTRDFLCGTRRHVDGRPSCASRTRARRGHPEAALSAAAYREAPHERAVQRRQRWPLSRARGRVRLVDHGHHQLARAIEARRATN